jgi:hypothetical protein
MNVERDFQTSQLRTESGKKSVRESDSALPSVEAERDHRGVEMTGETSEQWAGELAEVFSFASEVAAGYQDLLALPQVGEAEAPEDQDEPGERAPVFPFAPEASSNYRDLLLSLQIEEPHDENEKRFSAEIDAKAEVPGPAAEPGQDQEEEEAVAEKRWKKAKEPEAPVKQEEQRRAPERQQEKFAEPTWMYGDEDEAQPGGSRVAAEIDTPPDPIIATTVAIAAVAAAPHAQMARYAAIASPGVIRAGIRYRVPHPRRLSSTLLLMALLCAVLGFSQTYLFGGLASSANLDPSTRPGGMAREKEGTPPGQLSTVQPTAHPTKKPTVQPTKKPTVRPTKQPTVRPTTPPVQQEPTAPPLVQEPVAPVIEPTPPPVATVPPAPAPASTMNGSFTQDAFSTTARSALFAFGSGDWAADYLTLNYTVAGVAPQNVSMGYNSGAGRWEYALSGLNPGQTISYSFAFQRSGLQYYTDQYAFAGTSVDSGYSQGTQKISASSGLFTFSTTGWTAGYLILHYTGSGGAQQNVYMSFNSGAGRWEYTANFINPNPTVSYSFTYQIDGLQYDTSWYARNFA